MPRHGFRVAAALAGRAAIPILIVGGNHDRWGDDFWERDLGADLPPARAPLSAGRTTLAIHGDGLTEPRWRARAPPLINHPVTAALFRRLHPELAHRLVLRMQPAPGRHTPHKQRLTGRSPPAGVGGGALAREPDVGLVIMAHTHHAACATTRTPGQHT